MNHVWKIWGDNPFCVIRAHVFPMWRWIPPPFNSFVTPLASLWSGGTFCVATDINSNHNQPLPVDFSATVQEQLQRKTKHGIMDLKAVLFSSVKRRIGVSRALLDYAHHGLNICFPDLWATCNLIKVFLTHEYTFDLYCMMFMMRQSGFQRIRVDNNGCQCQEAPVLPLKGQTVHQHPLSTSISKWRHSVKHCCQRKLKNCLQCQILQNTSETAYNISRYGLPPNRAICVLTIVLRCQYSALAFVAWLVVKEDYWDAIKWMGKKVRALRKELLLSLARAGWAGEPISVLRGA